ncbi:centrosomal protein of 72 kDa-like isoform X2 [Acipenser oxyrinchus oxyrinchus]|uniref:Centrosomal protein of 72 kDa n=1 Tax=Acipenser oxyrinchus oxyrinchus TaxID=40147 RepID=A0AAD8GFI6_ACIOX|nr:centrosomal protein of 72 kDa-like isoform X2 [Acipenser oxyrinchus oxyrinchus]
MAAEKVTITEEWIRERVQLQHQNLADVRSLLLPGTYEGKIYHLGNSLKNFCRLKTLDLSRNALVSIEGIQHLKLLEKLNLYYNSIPSLNEIFHLRNLTALTELDLRLNPVVKNEPDYRLFIVHMLPNLRKLDDRPVRDSERKAAILHFGTELPFENQEASSPESETGNERTNQPRVSYVSCLSKKCSVLDEDDEAVLNLIAKCNWDLSKPPVITGSVKKAQEAELYPLQGNPKKAVQGLNGYHDGDETATSKQVIQDSETQKCVKFLEPNEKYQPLSNVSPPRSCIFNKAARDGMRGGEGIRVTFSEDKPKDLHAEFQDEAEAYHKITARGHFTPHPGLAGPKAGDPSSVTGFSPASDELLQQCVPDSTGIHKKAQKAFHYHVDSSNPAGGMVYSEKHKEIIASLPVMKKHVAPTLLESLLDQVDKYWNGKRSLHSNEKFLTKAIETLAAIRVAEEPDHSRFEDEMNRLKEEKEALHIQKDKQEQSALLEIQALNAQLSQTQKETETLGRHLKLTMEKNKSMENQLTNMEQKLLNAKSSNPSEFQIFEMQSHNQQLKMEIESLKQQIQHFGRIQELTQMLQESHRTLVSTNEHLLAELEEMRSRHRTEVQQLHWSYNELKKNMDIISTTNKGN